MTARRSFAIVALVGVWVLGWGEVSLINVLGGVVVTLFVLALFPLGPMSEGTGLTFRPLATAHLVGFFVVELVLSNVSMARDLLGRRSRIRTGVVAYPLRVDSANLLTFLANVLSLSPGTMPIDVDVDPKVIYLHVTRMHNRPRIIRTVARYEELALRAFGSPANLAALREVTAR